MVLWYAGKDGGDVMAGDGSGEVGGGGVMDGGSAGNGGIDGVEGSIGLGIDPVGLAIGEIEESRSKKTC